MQAPGLYLGDGVAWLESLPDDVLDGIFTDPPWGSGPAIVGQDMWLTLLARTVRAAERVVRPHGHIMLWYGQACISEVIRTVAQVTRLHLNAILVVEYIGSHRHFAQYSPLDYVLVYGRQKHTPPHGRPFCRMIYHAISTANQRSPDFVLSQKHSCARHVVTVGHILRDWFAPGMRIADPFAGTDTTGYQARRLGLQCWSWEIDPDKHALAVQRHAQLDLFAS
jgi:DNA modification methylase